MTDDKKLSVLGHLLELRKRLIKVLIALLIASILSFIFAEQIFGILTAQTEGIEDKLIFIEMTEMLGTYMKVCLASGAILTMPYIIYHAIMFVSPALTRKERRAVYLIIPWIALMFAGGVAFGYFILIPPATKFLLTFGSEIATPTIKIGNYVSIVTRLLLAIGLVFEMPVITTFLARLGIISSQWLASKRKIAVIGAFILAAIITPTFDPLNQSLVAAPLIVLYELSIWLARLVQRKREVEVTVAETPASDSPE